MTDGFIAVERRIRQHQAELFHTQSGLPMTYVIDGARIKVDRARPWLSMAGAREIWLMGPDATLTEVDQRITGRAYLFAILHDPRVAAWGEVANRAWIHRSIAAGLACPNRSAL